MQQNLSKSDRTKNQIIEKTAPVFNAQGYAGTSLADMIHATGLSKGCIYGNFQNKDEVALAAFDYNFGRVTAFIKEKILAREHAVDRLLVYPEVYRNFLKIPFLKPGCPILNTSTEADDTHPALRTKAADALSFWKRSIENQVRRGIERKEIKPTSQPAEVALVTMSLIEGAVMQAKVTGSSSDLGRVMQFLGNYLEDLRT